MNPVVELAPREDDPRAIAPADFQRFERYLGEILSALGMDLATPGTRETPGRLLQALVDATAGYDGDPKLHTAFPSERLLVELFHLQGPDATRIAVSSFYAGRALERINDHAAIIAARLRYLLTGDPGHLNAEVR